MLDLSRDALLKALNIDSKASEARLLLINVYLRQRNWKEVLRQIETYLQSNRRSDEREGLTKARDWLRKGSGPALEDCEVPFCDPSWGNPITDWLHSAMPADEISHRSIIPTSRRSTGSKTLTACGLW